MASWARKASCSAMASAISRCVSIVSSCRAPLVDSTNNGIELLITGISRGTTTFLLLSAIAVWNSISFWVWSACFFNNASTSSQSVVIFFISFLLNMCINFDYFLMESASFLASAVSSFILSNSPAFTRSPFTIQLPPQQRILSQERYSSRFFALIPPVGINLIPGLQLVK